MPSRSTTTFTQSSSRPTISEQTGLNRPSSPPSATKRAIPRSTASPTAIAWATLKATVALMTTPRAVASSIATSPAAVVGNLTWMFGASVSKWTACSTIRSALEWLAGFVWRDRRPLRPPSAANTGARIAAPPTPISSISAQVSSTSDHVGLPAASSRTRGTQRSFSFFMTSPTITGFEVAPVAPRATA